jgi:hypothetical protein
MGGFLLGKEIHRLAGSVRIVAVALAVLGMIAFLVFLRRNESRLEAEAERAIPGDLAS